MRQVAIIGLGNFGYYLGCELYKRDFDVIGLDVNQNMVQRIKNDISQAVKANATDKDMLLSLGIDKVELAVVTIGSNMLASIIATFQLKEIGVEKIYAKALSEEHAQILQRMGADEILFPEKDLALSLAQRVHHPNLLEYLPFMEDHSIVEIEAPGSFHGKSLRRLDLINRYGIQVIAIRDRRRNMVQFIPKADYLVGEDDELILLGPNEEIESLSKKFEAETE